MQAVAAIETSKSAAIPSWPRLLSSDLAATYLGISRTNFLARVSQHVLPQPRKIGERVLWDRLLLDDFVDALFGKAPANDQEAPADDRGW